MTPPSFIDDTGTATWKGVMLKDMTREELYVAFSELVASKQVDETLQSFVNYRVANPEQRFMQSLRNWLGVGFVATSDDMEFYHDTFHLEDSELPK